MSTDSLRRPRVASSTGAAPQAVAPLRWVRWFAVCVLLLATGSFFSLLPSGEDVDGSPLARSIWMLAYAVAAVGLFDGALRQRLRVGVPAALVCYVGLATASVAWSVGPGLSLRRSIGLAGTVVVGLFLAQRLRPLDLLDALRRALLIVAVSSLLLYATGSPLAVDEIHGTLEGVLSTKNSLGRAMALGLLAASSTALLDSSRTRRCLVSALPMLAALTLTGSTGGTLVALIVLVGMGGAVLWRARTGQVLLLSFVTLSLSLTVVLLPVATPATVTGLVGEDATLTGRTDIWTLTLESVAERPVLGYGYEAFWQESDEAENIRARLKWPVPSAHNGLIDVGLSLGGAGVALALLILASGLVRGIQDVASGYTEGAVLRLPLVALLSVSSTVESGLLGQNLLLTVMLVAALAVRRPHSGTWVDDALDVRARPRPDGHAQRRRDVTAGVAGPAATAPRPR